MSNPGDIGRRIEWIEGDAGDVVEQVIVKTAEFVGTVPGKGKTFEFGYNSALRDLDEDEEPEPGEPVRWYVKATLSRKLVRGGRYVEQSWIRYQIADPDNGGRSHAEAIMLAGIALLEAMGANVLLLTDLNPNRQD